MKKYVMTVTYDPSRDPENTVLDHLMRAMYTASDLAGVHEVRLAPSDGKGSDFVPGIEQRGDVS